MPDDALLDPSDDLLRALCAAGPGPRITLEVPLAPLPPIGQNALRMRQAVQIAEKKLEDFGAAGAALAGGLERAVRIAESHGADRGTLVCFVDPAAMRCVAFARPLPARVAVGEGFALRGFLRARALESRFHLLALSAKRLALYLGDARGLAPAARGELPASLEDALGPELSEKQLRMRGTAAGGGAPAFYSHDARSDERKLDFQRYRHLVASALERRLRGDPRPLILAADAQHVAALQEEVRLPTLLTAAVHANPDALGPAELHARAWPLVEAALLARDGEARGAFETARNAGKGADFVEDVAAAAAAGRVHRLWVAVESALPGTVDPATGRVGPPQGDDDVLDQIAALVMRHGGQVRAVPASALPSSTGVAAELR
jgi:hypothetical protein